MAPVRFRHLAGLAVLLAIFVVNAAGNLVLVPLGFGADENDHLDYVYFLAYEQRLPDPATESIGQIQHPPAAYGAMAVLLRLGAELDERIGGERWAAKDHTDIAGRRTLFRPGRRDLDRLTAEEIEAARSSDPTPLTRARYELRDRVRYGLRLVSVFLGLATLLLLFIGLRQVFPTQPGYALLATGAFSLTPHFPFHFAMVSNDPWSTFLGALIAALTLRAWRRDGLFNTKTVFIIAALLGLAFLVKLHAAGISVFVGCFYLFGANPSNGWKSRFMALAALIAGPLLVAGWWHWRQFQLQGGLLAVEHHAEYAPHLLRLETSPLAAFEFVDYAVSSFFGVLGQDALRTMPIYYIGASGMVFFSILGAGLVFFGRRSRTGETEREDADTSQRPPTPRLPIMASFAAAALLIIAIIIANRSYYHLHGRYFYSVLVPLALIGAAGIRRLCGRNAHVALGVFCVWNLIFAAFGTGVVVANYYSIGLEKVDRGEVAFYVDCGHPVFDQASAGGFVMRPRAEYPLRPEDTLRHAPQLTSEPEMKYRTGALDPAKRYQVRLRYPSPRNDFAGDVPAPSACVLLVDKWMIHGPYSLWGGLGELRFPLPHPITEDGRAEIWWQNHMPGRNTVACAELWVEEAWMQVVGDVRLESTAEGQVVRCRIQNIDSQDSHRARLIVRASKDGDWPNSRIVASLDEAITLKAGESKEAAIPLAVLEESERLRLQLSSDEWSPLAATKLAWFAQVSEGVEIGGRLEVPDLQVLRCRFDKITESKKIAEVSFPRLTPGNYSIGVSSVGDEKIFNGEGLFCRIVEAGGDSNSGEILEGWRSGPFEFGKGLMLTRTDLELTKPGESLLRLEIWSSGKSSAKAAHLDRVYLWRADDQVLSGHLYSVSE